VVYHQREKRIKRLRKSRRAHRRRRKFLHSLEINYSNQFQESNEQGTRETLIVRGK
jgi:hypothetical protein